MSRLGILLRKGHVFETATNHLVVDKTGTLTYGDMEIYQVDTYNGVSEKEVLAIAASIESHANHPIARAFQQYHDPIFR